jgi:hypothetical protein
VFTGNQKPDHCRIIDFRRRNLDAVKGLYVQILRRCQKPGMMSLGLVDLDGTKVKANACMYKAMSHERKLRAEKQLAQEINALMHKAQILDAQEDRPYGKGKLGRKLPETLRHNQGCLDKTLRPASRWKRRLPLRLRVNGKKGADQARAQAYAAHEDEDPAAEQADLNKRAEAAAAKARAARANEEDAATGAGLEPRDLQPLED